MFGRKSTKRKTYTNAQGYQVYKDSGVPVHRRVAEKKVGGPIWPGKVVHHKDGNKQNNHPDNLQVMWNSSHSRLEARRRNRRNQGGR